MLYSIGIIIVWQFSFTSATVRYKIAYLKHNCEMSDIDAKLLRTADILAYEMISMLRSGKETSRSN